MAAAALDVGYLAASYSVPATTLHSLLSEPTVELVQSLLVQIEARARQYDDLKSEKLRAEVELEGAVHNAEIRARTLQTTADNAVKEAEELRQRLAKEETARQQVETQLHTLQASATGSTSQVHTLESRVKTLEAQNRDTVALHEAKSAAHDRLAEELSAQHQKFVTLRKQVAELEEKNQALETAATSVKFRESNFQQEIELLRKNNEWFEEEMKKRSADNTKFRKEKNAQIAELQRAGADANQTIDSLRSKETAQGKRIEELEQRVEQSLSRVQQLQEEARQNQESFRAELDNARRLAALHQESANTVKKRLQEIQDQLNAMSDQAAEEVGSLQAEVESERNRAADYETKVAELESLLENQETQLSELRNSVHMPATPRRAMNGHFDTPGRAGSPMTFSPGGSRLKGGMSMTQLYTENTKLKAEVRALQDQNEQKSAALQDMINELENKVPEIQELYHQNETLTAEIADHSATLFEATEMKDAALKEVRKLQGERDGLAREIDLSRQQIRDMAFQCKVLLYHQQVRNEGLEALSEEEQQFFDATATNEIPAHLLDEEDSSTSRLISKHLVLFKNVSELQDKNQEVMRMIREVAERYEGSEAQVKAAKQEQDRAELLQLRDRIAQYEGEIDSLKLRSQSFMKERDMYRRIVTSRGQGGTPAPGESNGDTAPGSPPLGDSVMSSSQTKDAELIKELQTRLDTIKEEYATDRTSSKQQIDTLVKENRQLQGDNVRLGAKQEMMQERYDLLQHKISTLEADKFELKKQYAALNDQLAKSDTQRQQDSENLIEVKSQLDSLERENVNLKASQSLWKTIEARLTEDRNMLIEDKARLNKMINDMQTMRNEHDLAEGQNRRSLQARADSLEAELQNAKRKLEEETEDHKKLSMRHEWESAEKQRKIDDLVKASNEVRQELASVKSTRDQLHTRVAELQVEVQKAQERAPVSHNHHTSHDNRPDDVDEENLSREEQLVSQLADLQRQYDRAQEDLAAANTRADDLQGIAQGAEDRVLEVEEAAERLQQEFDEKVAELSRSREQVQELSDELTTVKQELSELRAGQSQEVLQLTQQQQSLESDISRLKEEVNDYKAEVESKTQDVAAQAEIANRAQQDYENEFRKHGETMNNLRTVRAERDKFGGEIMQYKTQAEAASASLAQNEEHWAATREQYERELAEVRTRYTQQEESNKTLYAQYDTLNAQIASLKSEQLSVAAGQSETGSLDPSLSGLQALNKILRDDKDVLQLQLNAKDLELQRVQQELTHKEEQLDRANEKLIVNQSQVSSRQDGANHQALQESIAQLNVYRESNTTLRNEKNRLEAERDEMKQKIETLNTEISPLKARVMELEGEVELNAGHIEALENDRDGWQQRHQDVLTRYNRIDPQELEDLKKQLEVLQTERDQAVSNLDERIQAVKDQEKASWEERKASIVKQARDKAKADAEKKRELTAERDQNAAERDQATAERDQVTAAREQVTAELEQVKGHLASVQSELESARQSLEQTNANSDVNMDEEGQVNEGETGFTRAEKADLEARLAAAEDKSNTFSNQSTALGIRFEELQKRERELESQIAEFQQRIGALNDEVSKAQNEKTQADARIKELQSGVSSIEPSALPQSSEEMEDLKEKLAAALKEVEDLQTRAEMTNSVENQSSDERVRSLMDQLTEQSKQIASIQATLEEREKKLAEVEKELAETQQKLAKAEQEVAAAEKKYDDREIKVENDKEKLKTKANGKIKDLVEKLRQQDSTMTSLTTEIEELKKQVQGQAAPEQAQTAPESVTVPSASTAPDGSISSFTISLPPADASEREIQDWISGNKTAQAIIKRNIQKRAEQEKKAAQGAGETTPIVPASPALKSEDKGTAEQASGAETITKEEHQKALARTEELVTQKSRTQLSMAKNRFAALETKWKVVEKAAEETPEEPVKTVFEAAKVAKPGPAPPANAPANAQPAQQQATQSHQPAVQKPQPVQPVQQPSNAPVPVPAYNAPVQQQPGQYAPGGGLPQANGARTNNFGQHANFGQPAYGQPMNPFSQSQGANQSFPNAMQNFGSGGIPQPGFANTQNQFGQFQQGRPNSPFAQQQQQHPFQQGGRGHADIGTGPAALRSLGQPGQTGIPRGGSNIPMPGRGRGGQQQQQQQHAGQHPNAQGTGQSQIGRGGGRGGGAGRGAGRGGLPQQPGSPMNPGAPTFQPGGNGAGRGQKRGAEDDGGGSQRGGKRARGGRGGGAATGGGGEE